MRCSLCNLPKTITCLARGVSGNSLPSLPSHRDDLWKKVVLQIRVKMKRMRKDDVDVVPWGEQRVCATFNRRDTRTDLVSVGRTITTMTTLSKLPPSTMTMRMITTRKGRNEAYDAAKAVMEPNCLPKAPTCHEVGCWMSVAAVITNIAAVDAARVAKISCRLLRVPMLSCRGTRVCET